MATKATPGTKPEFQVVEDKLYVQSTEGELVLQLDIPFKHLRALKNADPDADEADQLFSMLEMLGDKSNIKKLEELGSIKVMRIVSRFFSEFSKIQEAAMGEFSGSSNS